MMPSLYSGISGLNAHQRRMDSIGNNVANVNTLGYKSSSTTFQESYINTIRSPNIGTPGMQIGLGVNIGGITRRFGSGMLSETGISTNMSVNGNGWFVVTDGTDPAANPLYLTRAGDFVIDVVDANTINLITPGGMKLTGSDGTNLQLINLDPTSGNDLASFSVAADGTVTIIDTAGASETLGGGTPIRVKVATFQNNNGLRVEGANLYSWTAAAGGTGIDTVYNVAAAGDVLQGYVENSNTDLAREFTDMIVAQRGFQANAKTVTTSDEILMELMSIKR
ncbi:MAG: flagellar hook-basal body complex protein [Lentisphaerae bacterium]|nr:flagellar hook-basal body complex protein [Lentisphaerota bacterium]